MKYFRKHVLVGALALAGLLASILGTRSLQQAITGCRDLYRVDTPRELETLGLDDLVSGNSILLVEWGEKFPRFERERDVEITLERVSADERRIQIDAR